MKLTDKEIMVMRHFSPPLAIQRYSTPTLSKKRSISYSRVWTLDIFYPFIILMIVLENICNANVMYCAFACSRDLLMTHDGNGSVD